MTHQSYILLNQEVIDNINMDSFFYFIMHFDKRHDNILVNTNYTTATTTSTTTTTTAKSTTLKTSQHVVNNQGVNKQILPQYYPNQPNRMPVGSDMYNGNAYYWPSGYNQMYGTQRFPGNYGRFQGGVQNPYDPRLYGNGRQLGAGNGYVDPVRDYYDKLDSETRAHDSISQADLGIGISKGSKPGHARVKYPNKNIVSPVSEGRDGAPPVHNNRPAAGPSDKSGYLTTRPPTTAQPITQSVSTEQNLNKWKVLTPKTGWKSNSDNSSDKQNRGNIPNWKSNDQVQNPLKTSKSNHIDKTEQEAEDNVSKQQTSTKSLSLDKEGSKDMLVSKQETDYPRYWKQHMESRMGNTNSGTKTEVEDSQDNVNMGRIISGSEGQKNTERGENQGRKNSQNPDRVQLGRKHHQKGWKDGSNEGAGQRNSNHRKQGGTESGDLSWERNRGRMKGRPRGGYHRKQGMQDQGSDQAEDNSDKALKQKQKVEEQNTDYDSYFEKNPSREHTYGAKKPGHGRPAYKNQRPHNYQYYDSYKPYSYWNYDYYNYDDHPGKKYPTPFDQGETGIQCCLDVVSSVVDNYV